MRADSNQPHYAPSSVGCLMEPAFLRSARVNADGFAPRVHAAPVALWAPLRAAFRRAASAWQQIGSH